MFFYKTKENFSNNEQKIVRSRINSKYRRWGGVTRSKNIEGKISELFMYGLQKIKGKFKLAYSVFAVAIFMGIFSVNGFATRNISGYEEGKGYNYVYFGHVDSAKSYLNKDSATSTATSSYLVDAENGHSYDVGNTKYSLKFRVLDTTANDGETPALFMLTEYAIGQRRWDVTSSEAASGHNRQEWSTSEMRRWLNGYNANNEKPGTGESAEYINSVLPTCFSEEEQAAIMETTTHEAGEALYWYHTGTYMRWAGKRATTNGDTTRPEKSNQLEGDKIFLLSAEEVTNEAYGFKDNKNELANGTSVYAGHASRVCAQANATGGSVWWWLRSAYSSNDYLVAGVYHTGASRDATSHNTNGAVRFGLNVHLSSVIYASDAGVNLASVASPSTFKPVDRIVPSGDNPEYKLTILDKCTPEKQSFTTDKNSIITGVGNAIKINYSGAVWSDVNHECISAVIRDITSGDTLYYVYLKRCTTAQDESGELTIDLPDNLEPGSYKLMVMNERICGEYQTSSASVSDITLNIVENYPLACDIKKPVYAQAGSTYDYVYFGEADSEKAYENIGATDNQSQYVVEGESATVKKAPIKFRVLDTTSNGYEKDDTNKKRVPALFMLTEYAIGERRWDVKRSEAASGHSREEWLTSEMRRWLNGYKANNEKPGEGESAEYTNSVLPTCFSEEEQAAIMETKTHEEGEALAWYHTGTYMRWAGKRATTDGDTTRPEKSNQLEGDKIFLLSAEEVTNEAYGFKDNKNELANNQGVYAGHASRVCAQANATKDSVWWWLRSAASDYTYSVAFVNNTGASVCGYSGSADGAVRFGLNVPLSSVIYASDASRDLSNLSGFTSIDSISPASANPEYKLTILDFTRSNFSLNKNSVSVLKGESIVVSYENAKCTDDKEYMSAIIKDATTGEALYYGCFGRCEVASGKLVMPLPENIPAGAYKLVVINEKINGAYQTNYAGCVEITLNVTETYPLACNIENPKWDGDLSTYDYVFFGHVTDGNEYSNDDTKEGTTKAAYVADTVTAGYHWTDTNDNNKTKAPIQFRVLHTTSNGYDANSENTAKVPSLFMLTEYAIGQRRWDTGAQGTQDWSTSEMRAWLNGNDKCNNGIEPYDNNVLTVCFDDKEKLAIMGTTTHEAGEALYWYKSSNGKRWAGTYEDSKVNGTANQQAPLKSNQLERDKIFLLSAEEVTNLEYGFVNNKNESVSSGSVYSGQASRVCANATVTEDSVWWWLRSAYSGGSFGSDYVAGVRNTGASNAYYSGNPEGAVRFGLNVNLSSVIYASDASVNPANGVSLSTFKLLTSSNGYKLTLLDTTRDTFTAEFSENIISRLPGESVTISYSNATTGNDEFITVLIKDAKTGEAKCYNRYPVSSVNGSIDVTIPDETILGCGTFELLVMNEKVGRAGYTNYASPATKLTLRVRDESSPVVTNVYTNGDNTIFKLTAKDNWKLGKITTIEDDLVHKYLLDNTYIPGSSKTEHFESSCEMNSFKVVDSSNNSTVVSNIIVDNEGPRVESITYENGNYTIKVSDSQSGIWKITNSTGDVIYQRYDGITST